MVTDPTTAFTATIEIVGIVAATISMLALSKIRKHLTGAINKSLYFFYLGELTLITVLIIDLIFVRFALIKTGISIDELKSILMSIGFVFFVLSSASYFRIYLLLKR